MFNILQEHTRNYKKENQDVYTTLAENDEGCVVLIADRKKSLGSFQFSKKEVAENFFEEVTKCFDRWRCKETLDFLQNLLMFDEGEEAFLFIYTSTNGDLSEDQCWILVEYLGLSATICDNEALGEERFGWVTIQLNYQEDGDYFGEFLGERGKVNFQYVSYNI
jgi:hypothetical protein